MNPCRALAAGALLLTMASCSRTASQNTAENAGSPRACGAGDPSYSGLVRPVLEHYCFSCHSADGDAGDEHDFTHPELLRAQRRLVSARLRAHGMPPATSAQPSAAERALVTRWADCGAQLD